MSKSIFRKKTIERILSDVASGFGDGENSDPHLNKELRVRDLTLMGIAAIVGAGIFSTIGEAAYHGGPGVSILFVITAVTCGFSALCYAEFASRIPVAGSAYTYAYASFGELIAWIIGWDLLMEYAIGNIAQVMHHVGGQKESHHGGGAQGHPVEYDVACCAIAQHVYSASVRDEF